MTTKANRPAGLDGRAAAAKGTNLHPHSTTNQPAGSIPVRRSDGRIVGQLRGDVLSKRAKREHQLGEPAAWAWDCDILDAAERAGARFIEVECDRLIYRASLADFRRYGFPVNRGYGAQRGLALTYWHCRRVGEPVPAVQLSLFGGDR